MSERASTYGGRWRVWSWPALTLVGVSAIVVTAIVGVTANSTTGGERTPTAEPTPAPSPVPSRPRSEFDSGLVVVGVDIRPGTYRTRGPSGRDDCFWSRYSPGGVSVIDNGLLDGAGRITVDVGELVETSGCRPWQRQGQDRESS